MLPRCIYLPHGHMPYYKLSPRSCFVTLPVPRFPSCSLFLTYLAAFTYPRFQMAAGREAGRPVAEYLPYYRSPVVSVPVLRCAACRTSGPVE